MKLTSRLAAAVLVFAAFTSTTTAEPQAAAPTSGLELLDRMRAAYVGKWFQTLTFVQKTTIVRADDTRTEQTWFESLRAPDMLRIDVAPLANGNGSLNMPDSVIVMRGGTVASTRPDGNPFLPFVVGIYTQPLDRTVAQLAPQRYDLAALHTTEFMGRKTYVAGTTKRDDLTSPQFWVDSERLLVVRALLPSSNTAGAALLDVVLDNYVKAGGGWVAITVSMSIGGKLRQIEDYTDVRADVDLAADLFDTARWMEAKHWAAGRLIVASKPRGARARSKAAAAIRSSVAKRNDAVCVARARRARRRPTARSHSGLRARGRTASARRAARLAGRGVSIAVEADGEGTDVRLGGARWSGIVRV